MSRRVTITTDVLETGFRSVHLPHWTNGYRGVSANADGLDVLMTRNELRELRERLNEMDLDPPPPPPTPSTPVKP